MAPSSRPRPGRGRAGRRGAGRPLFAYTRARTIKSLQYLVEQGEHARREDATGAARVRPDATPGTSLGWSILDGAVPEPRPVHDTHYDRALAAHLERHKGRRRGQSPLGLHLFVNVSPRWIEEGGSLHDPANPRIRDLFRAVADWAQAAFGRALFALRIDLDETGGGVVDAFLAPLRHLRQKGKDRGAEGAARPLWISVNRVMEELTIRHGHRRFENFHAINSSWAAFAREHLDPRLVRGIPKRLTGRKHIPIDQVRQAHETFEAQEAHLEGEVAHLEYREAVLAEVMAAALAGRIGPSLEGRPEVRRGWTPAGGGTATTPGEDAILEGDLQLVEPGHGTAVGAAMAFVQRLLRLDRDRTNDDPSGPAEDDCAQSGDQAAAEDGPDDPFALPDPGAMTPRPW